MEQTLIPAIIGFFKKERSRMLSFIKGKLADSSSRDADDLIQDVMVKLIENADINVPIEKLSSYIYTSIRNKIVDMYRLKQNNLSLDDIDEKEEFSLASVVNNVQNAETVMEKNEYYAEIYKAIDELEHDEKSIIIATEFEDYTFRELSEEWGEPIGTLLSRKTRAIQKIRTILSKGGNKK